MVTVVKIIQMDGLLFEILVHTSNPAEVVSDQSFFHDGYMEVIITSDGSNPYFEPMVHRILLVVPKGDFVKRPIAEQNLHVVPVLFSTCIDKIIPSYGKVDRDDGTLHLSMVTLHFMLDEETPCHYNFMWGIVNIYNFFVLQ